MLWCSLYCGGVSKVAPTRAGSQHVVSIQTWSINIFFEKLSIQKKNLSKTAWRKGHMSCLLSVLTTPCCKQLQYGTSQPNKKNNMTPHDGYLVHSTFWKMRCFG